MRRVLSAAEAMMAAYGITDRTPWRFDCGVFCGKKCCKGDENDGMWLFPGEKEILTGENYLAIKESEGNRGYPVAVCGGSCDRKMRPMACRMYPFFPVLARRPGAKGGYVIKLAADIRATNACPLSRLKPDEAFLSAMRDAVRVMMRSPELREYLIGVSEEFSEMSAFSERLTGKRRRLY